MKEDIKEEVSSSAEVLDDLQAPSVQPAAGFSPGPKATVEEAIDNIFEKWAPAFKALSK